MTEVQGLFGGGLQAVRAQISKQIEAQDTPILRSLFWAWWFLMRAVRQYVNHRIELRERLDRNKAE